MKAAADRIGIAIRHLDEMRRAISRTLRYRISTFTWLGEYRSFMQLKDRFRGKRCFLIANGPSLNGMDLGLLKNEHVCLVNMGTRLFEIGLPQATFHVAVDNNRYRRFATDFEEAAMGHDIPYRFYSWRCRRSWQRLPRKGRRPHFLLFHSRTIVETGCTYDPRWGYGGCASVVLFAAQLLVLLGFQEVIVIGCDLDYDGEAKYAYGMTAKDELHENDPNVIGRRWGINNVSDQFEIVRRFFEEHGRTIVNAGRGGNLHSLPRVEYESLFEEPIRAG